MASNAKNTLGAWYLELEYQEDIVQLAETAVGMFFY